MDVIRLKDWKDGGRIAFSHSLARITQGTGLVQ